MIFSIADRQTFTLEVDPSKLSTAQQKGVRAFISKSGKAFTTFYKKKKVVMTERILYSMLNKHKPKEPIRNDGDTCVLLVITYMFPHTSNCPKWKRDGIAFMTQRPDVDNLSKSLIDCMTKCGFWEDDSMVNTFMKKFRSPNPCIFITIEKWRQEREPNT